MTCLATVLRTGEKRKILDASNGGVYGWWGMTFAFSPDGRLAYARPDGIGLVDMDGKYLKPLLDITPLNTHSDWAWLPSIAWGADGKTLYYISHAPPPKSGEAKKIRRSSISVQLI